MNWTVTKNILVLSLIVLVFKSGQALVMPNHQVEYYDPSKYANNLTEIEEKFSNKMQDLKTQIEEINQIIENKQIEQSSKIQQISEKMADEQSSLVDVRQSLSLPFQIGLCQCRVISDIQRKDITAKIQKVKGQIKDLEASVQDCSGQSCAKTTQLKQSIASMKAYVANLESTINKECCLQAEKICPAPQPIPASQQHLVNTKLFLNLDNLNFIYKNQHLITDYKQQIRAYQIWRFELISKYKTKQCLQAAPYSTPDFDGCFKCPSDKKCFNISTRECSSCNLNSTGIQNQCFQPNSYYSQTQQKCVSCNASNGQFANNETQKCQKCELPTYLNATTLQCQNCTYGKYYDENQKGCVFCPGRRYYSQEEQKCVRCPNNTQLNVETQKCDPCNSTEHYNYTIGVCFVCKEGSVYNTTSNKCQANNNNKTCPSQAPHYNAYENKCESCPVGQIFDKQLQKCIHANNIGLCPPDKPLYDNKIHQCVACPQGTQYNKYFFECDPITAPSK